MDKATTIKDVTTMWENGGSAWVVWMNSRYIRGQLLNNIQPKYLDSTNWRAMLRWKEKIGKCMVLGRGNLIQW